MFVQKYGDADVCSKYSPRKFERKEPKGHSARGGHAGHVHSAGTFPFGSDSHHKKSFLEDRCLCTVAVHTARVQALLWAPLFHQSHEAKHNLGCPELQGLVCVCIVLIYTARLPHGLTFL